MPLEKITKFKGRGVYIPGDDIDTDRVIPARFMKCITFDGLGEYAFYDERRQEDGTPKQHPMNDPQFEGATILLCGANFGCGSSREHAPQSLYRFGIRALIGVSFAEIFFGNSLSLGMPCLNADREAIVGLANVIEKDPGIEITVDLRVDQVSFGDEGFAIEVASGAKSSLLDGKWDPISDLMEGLEATDELEAALPY